MSDFKPFAYLVSRIRSRQDYDKWVADVEEACKALERLSPLCKLLMDAIEADKADCLLVVGENPNQRYVTVQDAAVSLMNEIMRPMDGRAPFRPIVPNFGATATPTESASE